MTTTSRTAKDIFVELVGNVSPDCWDERLVSVCAGDTELCHRVRALLRAHADPGSFLEQPVIAVAAASDDQPIAERPGTVIGPYKLLEQIGEGGMGIVFMAEQTQPVQRKVALKVVKPGMDSKQVLARFDAERQALALMDHPNIARVLDAGTTDTGRPYFVMDLVRGVPVTDYCDQHRLSIRERLELFVTICQAVQHAHQKGIIHRDLKPTNILVTQHDGRPLAKVIDFGVAKATGQKLTDKTLFTGFAQLIGTPLYMSPEQAELSEPDVDTRSDIYSLGVLLYELLTGSTPFEAERLRAAAFDELRRIIREEEPPRPSTRVSTLAQQDSSTISEKRNTDPRHLSRLFQGELDWIAMKTLEKDRNRRYETASALAADIERYLADEPVEACPPSKIYRLRKFAWRNKVALVTTAVVLAALILGTVVSTWQAIRATHAEQQAKTSERQALVDRDEKDQARREAVANAHGAEENAQRADEVVKFLVQAFRSPDPDRDGRTITIAEVLGRSVRELQDKLADDPRTKVALLEAIGESYIGLGLNGDAIPIFEQARDLSRQAFGAHDPGALNTMNRLARAYVDAGRSEEAIVLAEQTRTLCQAHLDPADSLSIESITTLAWAYQQAGRIDRALPLFQEAIETAKTAPGHADIEAMMMNLGQAYGSANRFDEALPLLKEAFELYKAKRGLENPETLGCMNNLAEAYVDAGRFGEVLPMLEEILRLRKLKLGAMHPDTLGSMRNLGIAIDRAGRLAEAIPILEETLKLDTAKHGPLHPETLETMYSLACAYLRAGRIDDATPLFEETLRLRTDNLGAKHPDTLNSIVAVAKVYATSDRLDEAITLLESTLKLARNRIDPQDPDTRGIMKELASDYVDAHRATDALPLYQELFRLNKAKLGQENSETIESMNDLAEVYLVVDRPAEAEVISRECLEILGKNRPDDWNTFFTRMSLGTALLDQNNYTAAEPLLVSGYEGMLQRIDTIPDQNKPFLKEAIERLVLLYEGMNQPNKVAEWKKQLAEYEKHELKNGGQETTN